MVLVVREVLEEVLEEFEKKGVKLVVIGSTIVDMYLGEKFKDGDIDLFSRNISPLVEEELFKEVAEARGWDYTYTELGTPRLIVRVGDREYDVDIYDNISDFYIPRELLDRELTYKKVGRVKVEHLTLEAYLALKSRIGRESDERDLEKISALLRSGKLKISKDKLIKILELFPEEEVEVMYGRLARTGIL